MEWNFFLKWLFLLFLFYRKCSTTIITTEVDTSIVATLVNSANELSRIIALSKGRTDFNQWFFSGDWRIKGTADPKYDFIIVGSGSAGSVIANRLSEIKKWNILVLEVGIPETKLMDVPMLAPAFQLTPYNWKYFMEYQSGNFFGLNDDRMHWPRGRALGGTSTINYMIYTRGNRWDYDRWAADGNPGWSYADVLPYFIKAERAYELSNSDPRFHGTNGYQSVENIHRSRLTDAFIEAGPSVGLKQIDYNANKSFGVAQIQATVKKGHRHSVATAFLSPIRERRNLDIIINAFVTKVLIDPTTKTAYGVTYDKNGRTHTVLAKKEVILSAGTFMSPQLLMLSGIGPRQHLEEIGIKNLLDLPAVGRNLHDHLTFPGLSFEVNQTLELFSEPALQTLSQYVANGTGPLTSLGGAEAIGYIKTMLADYPEDYPDIELLFIAGNIAIDFGLATYRVFNIKDEVFASLFKPLLINTHSWTILPILLHPKSTGYMKLRSKSPYDHPRFYGNFFTDPEHQDLETYLAAIRFIQKISDSPAFQKYGSRLNPRPMRTCEHLTFDSDDYWRCCIRSISVTLHHQVGTAKMGPSDDPTAVVNHKLQVHGIKNLRIADCSIIPRALGAHTNAPSIMVGEKASDIIKLDWGEKIERITA